jgi:hypothetical protein
MDWIPIFFGIGLILLGWGMLKGWDYFLAHTEPYEAPRYSMSMEDAKTMIEDTYSTEAH